MKYYCDITLLPDAEANLGFLWQKIFCLVHSAIVENQHAGDSNVALSFPEYDNSVFPLGNKLRVMAISENALQQLELQQRLNRLSDYCRCTSLKTVPEVKQFVRFERKQFASNMERIARRRAKRKGETFEEAMFHLKDATEEVSKLPFINVGSSSTQMVDGQKCRFKLFIKRVFTDKPLDGQFSTYGLSKEATVPWF